MSRPPENADSPAQPPAHFATTRWTVVMAARDKESPESDDALQALCSAYWPPLYSFVRRSGHSPHDAQDLTQEFFARLLQKDWLGAVERDRGRFRTFLIMAVKRFLANEWDKSQAARRGGGQTPVPLDTQFAENCYLADAGPSQSADHLYERHWALTLLEQAMARLRAEYESDGRGGDFEHLKTYLTASRGEIPYAQIAQELGASEGAARVAVHRLRKRFRDVFRTTVADTVSSAEEVDAEMRYVVEVLGRV